MKSFTHMNGTSNVTEQSSSPGSAGMFPSPPVAELSFCDNVGGDGLVVANFIANPRTSSSTQSLLILLRKVKREANSL